VDFAPGQRVTGVPQGIHGIDFNLIAKVPVVLDQPREYLLLLSEFQVEKSVNREAARADVHLC